MQQVVEDWTFNRSMLLGKNGGAITGPHPGVPIDFGALPTPSMFPFRTETAVRAFERARDLIIEHPTEHAEVILRRALEQEPRAYYDLTPEDLQLLKMAIEWLQNGPPMTTVRTGGMPGGPARFTGPNTAPPSQESVELLPRADKLHEFMAHPVAFGPTGIFSGGHAMPYPGIGNVAFGKHPPPWNYTVDPNALVAALAQKRRLPGREKEERKDKWRKLRKALGFPEPTSP